LKFINLLLKLFQLLLLLLMKLFINSLSFFFYLGDD